MTINTSLELASFLLGEHIPDKWKAYTLEGVVGLFAPVTVDTWEVHTSFAPECRGRQGMRCAKAILDFWHVGHPEVKRLVTCVRKSRPDASCVAIHLGFSRFTSGDFEWPNGETLATILYDRHWP